MTQVFIHGKLGKLFGRRFKFSINRAQDVFFALDANCNGFRKKVLDMSKNGQNYQILVDGKNIKDCSELSCNRAPKEIAIVPSLLGAAGTAAVLGFIAIVIGYTLPSTYPVLSAVLIAVGSAALSFGLSNLLQKDVKDPDIGSASAQSNALNRSFLFSNGENIAEQGNPVPIGYGRLRIGSSVIQSTIKSYPAKFDEKNSLPIYTEFTELATKRGLSQLGIFDLQSSVQTNI